MKERSEKITILIGCWRGTFVNDVKFFDYLKKKLGCKIVRTGRFVYKTRLNNKEITFQFCFGPDNDLIWNKRKKREVSDLPPSIGHLAKKGIKADKIYYLGFCGVFRGSVHDVFLPTKFVKVNFDSYSLHRKHVKNLKVSKPVKYDNKLVGLIKGDECTTVTSNQVLSLKYVENNSAEILQSLSRKLKKHADVVEMENYEVVRNFGKSHPIGILLYGTDLPEHKKHMLGRNTTPIAKRKPFDWKKFNKVGTLMIKKITRNL